MRGDAKIQQKHFPTFSSDLKPPLVCFPDDFQSTATKQTSNKQSTESSVVDYAYPKYIGGGVVVKQVSPTLMKIFPITETSNDQ